MTTTNEDKIPVGISTCLLGANVRYDGGHKHDHYITDILGEYFRWNAICPEVDIGLGTPREPIRLVNRDGDTRLIAFKTNRDLTDKMVEYSKERTEALAEANLRGYILKKDSPSCGMTRVKVHDDKSGLGRRSGVGMYANALLERFPNLPVEEEGRLKDRRLLENFITRVFAYHRWMTMRENETTAKAFVRFHTQHKMLLLAHAPKSVYKLGRIVAEAGSKSLPDLLDQYEEVFMQALRELSTPGRHVNVMQHLMGFLKDTLNSGDKGELARILDEYKAGWLPLSTPLALLQHHLKKVNHAWVDAQVYLEPYPRKLALRSQL